MEFVLTPEQLFTLQWIAQGITQLIKIGASLLKRPIPDEWKLGLVFVVSGVVGYLWAPIEWPVIADDPMAFALALISNVGIVMAVASLVYDRLTGPVLGWLDKQVLSRIPGVKKLVPLLKP